MEDSLQDTIVCCTNPIFQRIEITAVKAPEAPPTRTLLTAISSLLVSVALGIWLFGTSGPPRSNLLDAAFILSAIVCMLSLVLLIGNRAARAMSTQEDESVPDDQDRDSPPPH